MKLPVLLLRLLCVFSGYWSVAVSAQLVDFEDLVPLGADWEFLYYSDTNNVPVDPASVDPAFATNWFRSAYTNIPFEGPAPAMLGWGDVPNDPNNAIVTDIWNSRDGNSQPPAGNRFTVYLRTTFTPTSNVEIIRFEGIVDDGCFIYLDGIEVGRINMSTNAIDTWTQLAQGNGNENAAVATVVSNGISLAAGVPVDLAVSLHNVQPSSSDIALNLGVTALVPPFSREAPNNNFANANTNDLIGAPPFDITGRNDDTLGAPGADKELGEPDHGGEPGGASVWWCWTAVSNQRVNVNIAGSSFDGVLAVYTGTSVDALTEVGSSTNTPASVTFDVNAGTTYYMAVDGRNRGVVEVGDIALSMRSMANNDDYDAANTLDLVGALPANAVGQTADPFGNLVASKEVGEPDHAGNTGGGSLWWAWTCIQSQRVVIDTTGSNFDTLLAVYTGNSLSGLNLVAANDESPFHNGEARVAFDAVFGTTYFIAVDGKNDGAGPSVGNVDLEVRAEPSLLKPVDELIAAESDWEYLLLSSGNVTNTPLDPATVDPDFHNTWHSPSTAVYDGPAFSTGPALLGYGVIDAAPIATDVWAGRDGNGDGTADVKPPNNLNGAVYFRKTFIPTTNIEHLGFEGLIDDGVIIFINGVEVERLNVPANGVATNWLLRASGTQINGANNEVQPSIGAAYDVNLPANQPVDIAATVVSASGTSSDIGFDLRVLEVERNEDLFFDLDITRLSTVGAPTNQFLLVWESLENALYDVEFSLDLNTWIPTTGGENISGGSSGAEAATITTTGDKFNIRVRRKR